MEFQGLKLCLLSNFGHVQGLNREVLQNVRDSRLSAHMSLSIGTPTLAMRTIKSKLDLNQSQQFQVDGWLNSTCSDGAKTGACICCRNALIVG